MTAQVLSLSPSALARKIMCAAYVSSPMTSVDRMRFLGFHSQAMIKVIKRHLSQDYRLLAIEVNIGNRMRVDLVFEAADGRRRMVEVKSAKKLSELHRLQAALYWTPEAEEIVVSNGNEDLILPLGYITSVQEKALAVSKLLKELPDIAATDYNPVDEVCRICANSRCPFVHKIDGDLMRT